MSAWVLQTVVIDFTSDVRLCGKTRVRPQQPPQVRVAVTVGDVLIRRPAPGPIAAAAALLTAVVVTALGGCGQLGGGDASPTDEPSVVTSTTRIAGAGVLGNQRRPDESCAPNPVPVDPGEGDREVRHAAGSTVVRAEPQKIVVLSGDQLDALCALGLQSRIVAAALPDGSESQPSYLGTRRARSARGGHPQFARSCGDPRGAARSDPGVRRRSPPTRTRSCRPSPRRCSRAHRAPPGRTTFGRSARRRGGPTPPTG